MNLTTRSWSRAAVGRHLVVPDAPGHQHVVEFYNSEEFLVGTVAGFVGPGLNEGDAAVVVATASHRGVFEAALRRSGVDVAAAAAGDRYLSFDAAELLETFMVGGVPDPGRFAEMAGAVIERASAGGRRVRIYGEMVALLWDAGDVTSAIALEGLWNDLAGERDFMLLCAYPMASFEHSTSGTHFRRICDQHSTVIPNEDYALLGGADAEQRAVAQLQQQAAALKAEVARLRADQMIAELDWIEHLAAGAQRTAVRRDSRTDRSGVPVAVKTTSHVRDSPGGRLLSESLQSLSSRLSYAD